MPGSVGVFDNIFKEQINILQPKKVLDIGAGAGKYSNLIKSTLSNCTIHAVEPETSYISKFDLEKRYDKVFNKSIQQFIIDDMNGPDQYDLVICGDVLEHLFLSEMHDVVDFFSYRCRWLIAQFPNNSAQYAEHGINWEVHRCNLSFKDFVRYNIVYYNAAKEIGPNTLYHQYIVLSMCLNDFVYTTPTSMQEYWDLQNLRV